MKKIIFIISLTIHFLAFCQINEFDRIPKEDIFINTNSTVLLTGESLYYKFNCFKEKTNIPSNISKMAYVILVNDAKEIIFKHKLKLNKGSSYGDYFILTNLTTGNYKLIAYTNWMNNNNNKENLFFLKDLYIINPYTNRTNIKSKYIKKENICSIKFTPNNTLSNLKNYSTRSKVTIHFNDLKSGNYSLSIRKEEALKLNNKISTKKVDKKRNNKFYLPEMRGELISGTVLFKSTSEPIKNKIVSLSIFGNNAFVKNAKTNDKGKFYFNIIENYNSGDIILQLLDIDKDKYKIIIDKKEFENMLDLKFSKVVLDSNIKKWLLENSINTQIENAYFELKKDSIIKPNVNTKFYGKPDFSYILDQYKRFSTVKETFVEVIEGVRINLKKNKIIFHSSNLEYKNYFKNIDILILIDGVALRKHETLINFDPYKIERLDFVNDVYYLGDKVYNGIIDVTTIKGDYRPSNIDGNGYLDMPINRKQYFQPNYDIDSVKLKRIPDNRTQLLWLPNFNPLNSIDFFTSDVKGRFKILVEGFSTDGIYVKKHKYIEVK